MHYICYTCEEDNCQTHFAVDSMSDVGSASCPNCCSDSTNTGEVVVNPDVMGEDQARQKGHIA